MNEQLAAIKARREAAERDPRNYTGRMLADIDTLLAHVAALTAERDQLRQRAEAAEATLAERTLVVEQLQMALHVKHTELVAMTARAEAAEATLALADRYGADQWRRGNAGKDPQGFSEWQKEAQP